MAAEMWGEYFPEDEPQFSDEEQQAMLRRVGVPVGLSDAELRAWTPRLSKIQRLVWKLEIKFREFTQGVRLAFVGEHPSFTLTLLLHISIIVGTLYGLKWFVSAVLLVGGAR